MVRQFANTIKGVDKRYLVSGFSSLGSNHLAGVLIALLTSYFFANYLSKGVYGNYQFVLTMLGVMSIFTLRGVGKQIVREYVQTGRSILIPKTVQFILYALPISVVGFGASLYFYTKGNPDLSIALFIISLVFPLLTGLPQYRSHLFAKEDFKRLAILGVIQNAIPAAALIAVMLTGASLVALILTYCISHVLTLLMIYAYTAVIHQVSFHTKAPSTSTEVHLSLGQSILEIGKISDKLITFSFLGAATFATYMIAILPVREMLRLPQILRSLVLPKFSKYTFEQVRSKALGKTLLLFFIFSCISVCYILVAPLLFKLIFPLYTESVIYTQIFALILPFSSNIILVQMLTVFDRTTELYITNIIFSVTSVILTLVLVINFGLFGVIYAKLLATLIRFIALLYFSFSTNKLWGYSC